MSDIIEKRRLLETMRMLSTRAIILHQAVADTLNLNLTDYKCWDLIANLGPMTAGKLADSTGLTTGAITGVIDRLEKAGYVKRKKNPEDRRSVIIELNQGQEHIRKEVFFPLEQKIDRMVSSYTKKELTLFIELIDKEIKILYEETARLSKKSPI
jgi:DNA-binding MarR family transcriptional regulator